MRIKHSALVLTAGFLLIPTLTWSQGPGRERGGERGGFGGPPPSGGFGGSAPGFGGGAPSGGGMGGFRMDPDQLFNRMSGGKDVIRVDEMDARSKMIFDMMGARLGLTGPVITREQFKGAMEKGMQMAASGQLGQMSIPGAPGGPPGGFGGPGGGDSDRRLDEVFKRMDKNEDGVLDYNEMSETLQGERDKHDSNHDGFIDPTEFKAYVAARRGDGPPERGADGGGRKADGDNPAEEERKRPTLIRAGNLPKEFPYAQMDTDLDGQVGLYEWKKFGKVTGEFLTMDLNNDGFMTVDEYFQWRKQGQDEAMKASGHSGNQFARGGPGRGPGGPGMMAMAPGMMPGGPGQWPAPGGGFNGGMMGGGSRGDRSDRGMGMSGMPMGMPGGDRGSFTPGRGMDFSGRMPGGNGSGYSVMTPGGFPGMSGVTGRGSSGFGGGSVPTGGFPGMTPGQGFGGGGTSPWGGNSGRGTGSFGGGMPGASYPTPGMPTPGMAPPGGERTRGYGPPQGGGDRGNSGPGGDRGPGGRRGFGGETGGQSGDRGGNNGNGNNGGDRGGRPRGR